MQRMWQPALDCTARRNQRLPDHLSTEHPLQAGLQILAAKQVYVDGLEVEDGEQIYLLI